MTTLPTAPHLSAIRETALAIKHTAAFALAFHDRELARDRSGRAGLHRDVLAEMKALGDAAGKGLGEVRGCVGRLKEGLGEGGEGWCRKSVSELLRRDSVSSVYSRSRRATSVDLVGL
jgi:hypothetical protein